MPRTNNLGRFGYTGQTKIGYRGDGDADETELWHYKARAYHPRLGRFMQTDPIGYGDGLNLYAYAGGDPVNRADPSGTISLHASEDIITVRGSSGAGPRWATPETYGRSSFPRPPRLPELPEGFSLEEPEEEEPQEECDAGGVPVDGASGAARQISPNANDAYIRALTSALSRADLSAGNAYRDWNANNQYGRSSRSGRNVGVVVDYGRNWFWQERGFSIGHPSWHAGSLGTHSSLGNNALGGLDGIAVAVHVHEGPGIYNLSLSAIASNAGIPVIVLSEGSDCVY